MDGVRPGSERGTIRTQVDAIGTGVQSNGPQHFEVDHCVCSALNQIRLHRHGQLHDINLVDRR